MNSHGDLWICQKMGFCHLDVPRKGQFLLQSLHRSILYSGPQIIQSYIQMNMGWKVGKLWQINMISLPRTFLRTVHGFLNDASPTFQRSLDFFILDLDIKCYCMSNSSHLWCRLSHITYGFGRSLFDQALLSTSEASAETRALVANLQKGVETSAARDNLCPLKVMEDPLRKPGFSKLNMQHAGNQTAGSSLPNLDSGIGCNEQVMN